MGFEVGTDVAGMVEILGTGILALVHFLLLMPLVAVPLDRPLACIMLLLHEH